jgi:steroid delta-isomerase-like uncharacterized protein
MIGQRPKAKKGGAMSEIETNKAIARSLYDALNRGDLNAMDDFIADDFVEHEELPGLSPTKEGVKQYFGMIQGAFPDFRFVIDALAAEGDLVIARCRMTGTHRGAFMGFPATGGQINVPLVDFLRVANGRVTEHWGVLDSGALIQQLGGNAPS